MKRVLLSSAICALALLAACGSSTPATTTSTTGRGAGGSAGGSAAGGGGSAPVIDPGLFDCTAKKAPERINPVPVGCATDASCTTHLVSGHRGAGGELGVIAPEDTVAAVRAAIALGLDFVETDPRPTKDGHLVNVHDTSVDRTTTGKGEVDQLTLAEVQALTLVTDEFPGDYSCEHIPTLEQILTAAKGKVHVLIDANKTDRVDLLVGAITSTGTLDWAIFDTSSVDKIDQALALEPGLHTMLRVTSTDDLAAQLAHFGAHPPVMVEIEKGADTKALIAAIHAAKNRALTDVFASDVAANLSHDPKVYETYFDEGYDIVQSDRPDIVLATLGRWPPAAQP
jgi:glycerophosphoryl diester phosphodiesterase